MRTFLNPEVYRRVRVRSRGYLPHWELENGTYHIIYRERDSLPSYVLEQLRQEHKAIQRSICGERKATAMERSEIAETFGMRLDTELDMGRGNCRLREFGQVAADNLKHFDGQRYELIAFCVMPNHVHAVITAKDQLSSILHSWKSYVAHKAGEKIFMKEYFDRLMRDERDLERTVSYVRANPRKAGLHQWPWIG